MTGDYEVQFQPAGRKCRAKAGMTIRDVAMEGGIGFLLPGITSPCGGRGLCGRCRVRVVEGIAGPVTEAERKALSPGQISDGWRLACMARVKGNLEVEVPPESLEGKQSLQVEGLEVEIVLEPPIHRYRVKVPSASLEDPLSDGQRVARAMGGYQVSVTGDLEALRRLPGDLRNGKWEGEVSVRGGEMIGFWPGTETPRCLGLAVDLGTTKVAGYLVDLGTGDLLASAGLMNPQIPYGEDVMSRLTYALEGREKAARIHRAAVDAIGQLGRDLSAQVGLEPGNIEETVVVGNPAMHHLFLDLPVRQMALSPYVPAASEAIDVKSRELGLPSAPGSYVHVLPVVAGFVGGDHVAMVLAPRIHQRQGVILGFDIGTNTEIVLSRDGRMTSNSCASGPAFEGAHILHGTRALSGAIDSVKVDANGVCTYTTIEGAPAMGICGSGILDAVAQLYAAGVLDWKGTMVRDHPLVTVTGSGAEYVLVPEDQTAGGRPIVVTQKDVREIQLAKSAIASGMKALLEAEGVGYSDIDEIIIAGAFGTHIAVDSAVAIGMFPDIPRERFRQVGNAAGTGARMCLASLSERETAREIARSIRYMELMAFPGFNDMFVNELGFPVS
ncbi:MAG: ASKHA domain-containing protein [Bacillota bacterium]